MFVLKCLHAVLIHPSILHPPHLSFCIPTHQEAENAMLVQKMASKSSPAPVKEGLPAALKKTSAQNASRSPDVLVLKRRKKLSVEEQRAQQEAESKAAESDVEDREANGEEDDGEEEAGEMDGLQQYERITVPSTHPETSPGPKGLPFTLVITCAAWYTRAPPITTAVYALCPISTTLLPPHPTCPPGKVNKQAKGDKPGSKKGTTCTSHSKASSCRPHASHGNASSFSHSMPNICRTRHVFPSQPQRKSRQEGQV